MSQDRWTAVDDYVSGLLAPHDAALEAALAASEAAGLPAIQVSAAQGRLLQLLAQSNGSRYILEIGTLGGYSTIWMARALPRGGTLVTLEYEPKHAEVARANLERAGVADRVTVRVGAALETLPKLAASGAGPFDFVFVDADKENMAEYVDWAIRLAAPGALIVADNVVREGAVADAASTDPRVLGVRRMLAQVAADPRVTATVVQTVGAKGYDGFALIRTAG
jgi:predicted O-methyltransferase YrrM